MARINNLWLFGDSFSADYVASSPIPDPPNDNFCWHKRLAEKFSLAYKNYSYQSTGLDYLYERFDHVRDQMNVDDIVICTLTEFSRSFLFADRPTISTLWSFENGKNIFSKEEKKAFEYYELYLKNIKLSQIHLRNFLHNLQSLNANKRIKTIVLPGFGSVADYLKTISNDFELLDIAEGNLNQINLDEYADKFIQKNTVLSDGKCNHLIRSNHEVLFRKLYDNIINGKKINLNDDMIQNVINENTIADKSFKEQEFLFEPRYR